MVICSDVGGTMILVAQKEELDEADSQIEETEMTNKQNASATKSKRRRSKRQDQSVLVTIKELMN